MHSATMVKNVKNSRLTGIHQVKAVDNEQDLFKAYSDFAYYHSSNAAEMYENGAAAVQSRDEKMLFLQLACLKRDMTNKLRMDRPNEPFSFAHSARRSDANAYARYLMDVELSPRTTLKEAFDYAYDKEIKTLNLYEKMAKAAYLSSTKVLFDYLIESQRSHILFLDSQLAITNGDLNRPVPVTLELEYAGG